MKKSGGVPRKGLTYSQREKEKMATLMSIAMDEGAQEVIDFLQCVLHDPDIMGKDTFGRARIEKVTNAIAARDKHYKHAFDATKVDADYMQECLDRELREIFGDELTPFAERHPYLSKQDYTKPRKEWVE